MSKKIDFYGFNEFEILNKFLENVKSDENINYDNRHIFSDKKLFDLLNNIKVQKGHTNFISMKYSVRGKLFLLRV